MIPEKLGLKVRSPVEDIGPGFNVRWGTDAFVGRVPQAVSKIRMLVHRWAALRKAI